MLKDLEMGEMMIIRGPKCNHKESLEEGGKIKAGEGAPEAGWICSEDGRRGHKPRKVGSFPEDGRDMETGSLKSSLSKEPALCTP